MVAVSTEQIHQPQKAVGVVTAQIFLFGAEFAKQYDTVICGEELTKHLDRLSVAEQS